MRGERTVLAVFVVGVVAVAAFVVLDRYGGRPSSRTCRATPT
ncbi:hypothetical protein [Dactylosporangium cerinum]